MIFFANDCTYISCCVSLYTCGESAKLYKQIKQAVFRRTAECPYQELVKETALVSSAKNIDQECFLCKMVSAVILDLRCHNVPLLS